MKVIQRVLATAVVLVALATPAQAASINIGFLLFDQLVAPGEDGAPGVNVFTIANLTGDPASLGFDVADFPVSTSLTFTGLTMQIGGSDPAVGVDPLGPGVFAESLPDSLRFLDSAQISSAVLAGTISASLFTLFDGTQWAADSTLFSTTLRPAEGSEFLGAGMAALITIEASLQGEPPPAPVPEPGTLLLLATGIAALAIRKARE